MLDLFALGTATGELQRDVSHKELPDLTEKLRPRSVEAEFVDHKPENRHDK